MADGQQSIATALLDGEIIELGHILGKGMPQLQAHPSFVHSITERHGEHPSKLEGISHANDLVVMGLHTGAHMDAIGHISRRGLLFGERPAKHLESGSGPLAEHGAEHLPPYVLPGMLFDIAALRGVDALTPGEEVTPDDLEAALGDRSFPTTGWCALVRTGWDTLWHRGGIYSGRKGGMPGPRLAGAKWLVDHGAILVGSDTAGFEAFPADDWYVHAFLLVDRGIPIMENMNLIDLANRAPASFVFLGLPLRVRGATAGPMRPVAVIDPASR